MPYHISSNLSNVGDFFLELYSRGLYLGLKKELENRCLVLPLPQTVKLGSFTYKKNVLHVIFRRQRSKGWRSGESACLPPMWPGFKSRRRRHMWVEFVVGSLPCSDRFFSRYSGFPLSSKPNSSKFQFVQESGRDEEPLGGCATSKSLFIIYFIIYYLYTCKTVVLLIQSSFFAVLVAVVVAQS